MDLKPVISANKSGFVVNLNIVTSHDTTPYSDTVAEDSVGVFNYRVSSLIDFTVLETSSETFVEFVGPVTSIGYLSVGLNEKLDIFPLENDFAHSVRMATSDGVGCFELVATSDPLASRVRIATTGGVRAIRKRS